MPDQIPPPRRTLAEYAGCAGLLLGAMVVGGLLGAGLWTLVRYFQEGLG